LPHKVMVIAMTIRQLKMLLSHPNRMFSRNELINVTQGYEFEGYERTIDSHIKNLRKKIAGYLPGHDVINTIYGVGYKLNTSPGLAG
jgi:two-component system, OmpR family, response regulator BaeR